MLSGAYQFAACDYLLTNLSISFVQHACESFQIMSKQSSIFISNSPIDLAVYNPYVE